MRTSGVGKKILVLVVVCALAAGCSDDLVVLKPGDAAPPFILEDLNGNRTSLSGFRGRYVMVRFWADWCKACRIEMPLMEEKFREHHRSGLDVLALNVKQDRERAAGFMKNFRLTYPALLDRDGGVAADYGVIGLPTTFLIDREGRIMEEIIGDMNRKTLSELLDPLFEREGKEASP